MPNKNLDDFTKPFQPEVHKLDDNFLNDWLPTSKKKALDSINESAFLRTLYEAGQLYISAKYMDKGRTELESQASEKERSKINQIYDKAQDFEKLVLSTLKEFATDYSIVSDYNATAFEMLQRIGSSGSRFDGLHIELFPSIEITRTSMERYDLYSLNRKVIEICPRNFDTKLILPRSDHPEIVVAHEIAHAIDDQQGLDSGVKLKEKLDEFHRPESSRSHKSMRDDKLRSLEYAAKFYNPTFASCYDISKILDANGEFVSNNAAYEFLSFHAQQIASLLKSCSKTADFKPKYQEYINAKLASLAGTVKNKLFALDAIKAYTGSYLATMSDWNRLTVGINEVIGEKIDIIRDEQIQKAQNTKPDPEIANAIKASIDGEINKVINRDKDFSKTTEQKSEQIWDEHKTTLREAFSNSTFTRLSSQPDIKKIYDTVGSRALFKQIVDGAFFASKQGEIDTYIKATITTKLADAKIDYLTKNLASIEKLMLAKEAEQDKTTQERQAKADELAKLTKEAQDQPDPENYKKEEIESLRKAIKAITEKSVTEAQEKDFFRDNISVEKIQKDKDRAEETRKAAEARILDHAKSKVRE